MADRLQPDRNSSPAYFVGSQEIKRGTSAGHLNVLLFGNSNEGITKTQNKSRLIPGGEDLGYVVRTSLRATGQKTTLDYFSQMKMVLKGPKPLQPLPINKQLVLGSAVCSSIIASEDYRKFTNQGATILTNSASLGIFNGSSVFTWQQKSLARFMAISNSRYFLQSANAANAYALDNNGRQVIDVPGVQAASLIAKTNSQKTPYTYTGEVLAIASAGIFGVWVGKALLAHYKPRPSTKTKHRSS